MRNRDSAAAAARIPDPARWSGWRSGYLRSASGSEDGGEDAKDQQRVRLFGSVARGEERDGSDIDLLADDEARASLRRAAAEDEAGQAEVLTYRQARKRFRSG
jgi:Nucleotidyltransferase domain